MKNWILFSLCLLLPVFCHTQNWEKLDGPLGVNLIHVLLTKQAEDIFVFTRSQDILVSHDLGNSWENINTGFKPNRGSIRGKFIESPDGRVFLNATYGLYEYQPITKSWTFTSDPDAENLQFGPNGIIYAVDHREFSISKDYGQSFEKIKDLGTFYPRFECKGNNNNFIVRTSGSSNPLYVFNDDGTQLNFIINIGEYTSILFHTKTGRLLYTSGSDLFASLDKGRTWNKSKINGAGLNEVQLFELSDSTILATDGLSYFISADGGLNWSESNKYAKIEDKIDYSGCSFNSNILLGNRYSVFLMKPNGEKISCEVPINKPFIYSVKSFGATNILCEAENKLQISSDDGKTWKNTYPDIFQFETDQELIDSDGNYFTIDRKNRNLKIYNLINYSLINKPLPDRFYSLTYNDLKITKTGKIVLFGDSEVFISSDKGNSWQDYSSNRERHFLPEQFSFSSNDLLYMGYNDSIIYSKDYGISWNSFYLPTQPSLNFYYYYFSKNDVYYWTDAGINSTILYSTNDFGKTIVIEDSLLTFDFLFVDDYGTLYYGNQEKLYMKAIGISTLEEYDYSGLDVYPFEVPRFELGENGYLYSRQECNLLYKSSTKLVKERGSVVGKVILDENQNCVKDIDEIKNQSWNLKLQYGGVNYTIKTDQNGKFNFSPLPGDYKISLNNNSLLWQECEPDVEIKVEANTITHLDDILIKPIEFCPYIQSDVSMSRLRRCFDNNQATVSICNSGTEDAFNTSLSVQFDQYFENITSNINPILKNGNEWNFEIPEIKRGKCIKFQFSFRISCNASLGEIHCLKAISKNDKECNLFLPLTDTSRMCIPNIGSFDPNDKMAFVNDITEEKSLLANQDLKYLVRFQNTGSDTAFKVVVKDRLSEHLDWSSLKIVSASHDFSYTLDPTGLLELTFENIMLPDSNINSLASNGFFKYEIKQKKDLKPGTHILNDASIFFDFNSPVLTNLTHLVVNKITRTENINETLYNIQASPNPFNEETHLKLPDEFEGQMKKWSVYNISGLKLMEFYNRDQEIKIKGTQLHNGFYLVYVVADNNLRASGKIVVCKF